MLQEKMRLIEREQSRCVKPLQDDLDRLQNELKLREEGLQGVKKTSISLN